MDDKIEFFKDSPFQNFLVKITPDKTGDALAFEPPLAPQFITTPRPRSPRPTVTYLSLPSTEPSLTNVRQTKNVATSTDDAYFDREMPVSSACSSETPPSRPASPLTCSTKTPVKTLKKKKKKRALLILPEPITNITTNSSGVVPGAGDVWGGSVACDLPRTKKLKRGAPLSPTSPPPLTVLPLAKLPHSQNKMKRGASSLKDLLCRSLIITTREKRPSTMPFKELEPEARHILRGKFYPNPSKTFPDENERKCLEEGINAFFRRKRVCLSGCRYEVLPAVAKESGFEIVSENELWNINWSDIPLAQDKIMQMRRIQDMYSVFWGLNAPLQRMNHFPGMYEICRKDRLGRNLNRLKRMFPNDYNFFPDTWDLPTEAADVISFARRRKNITFIIKPESGCQGKGIFLLRNLKKLSPFAKCVCQVYMPHPFLIDGYKFDQRIYVLITCVEPLRLYIYDEGIARFATVKYKMPTDENLEVVFMHLTNYSLNKFSESYVREGDGSKRKLTGVYQWMSENGHDVAKLCRAIDDIVVKTILCAAPTLRHNYKASFPKRNRGCSCFELLGFDILVDKNMNPILLEVNHSPSFNLDLPVDIEVKKALLTDLLNMVYLGDALGSVGLISNPKNGKPSPFSGIPKKGKFNSKKGPSPPGTHSEEYKITNKALVKQFQHEMKYRGNFRLIYSSEQPGEYARLSDEHYYLNIPTEVGPRHGMR